MEDLKRRLLSRAIAFFIKHCVLAGLRQIHNEV
jgi:hypothetical protein